MKLKFSALKIFLILIVLLFSFGFVFAEGEEGEEVVLLPAPQNPIPSDSQENVRLDSYMNLTLKWDDVSGAKKYICAYWKEGNEASPSYKTVDTICDCSIENANTEFCCKNGRNGITDNGFVLNFQISSLGEKYYWQVKSCDSAGVCGYYGTVWSFTLQPELETEIPSAPTVLNKKMGEVTIDWADIPGAKSYILSVRLPDANCDWYNWVAGFFTGGKCSPWEKLGDIVLSWFGFGDFIENYDFTCPWKIWDKETGCNPLSIINTQEKGVPPESVYLDKDCIFKKNEKYEVKIAACVDELATLCGPYSSGKTFTTDDVGTVPGPELKEPYFSGYPLPVIGLNDSLKWNAATCTDYIELNVWRDGTNIATGQFPSSESAHFSSEGLSKLFDEENLNKDYYWGVRACWRVADDIKCGDNPWSEFWQFKTVGAPPTLLSPLGETISTPIILEWESIKAAKTYKYQVSSSQDFSRDSIKKEGWTYSSKVKIDYTFLKPNTQYWWRVKTCADDYGDACGTDWNSASFSTFPLSTPTDPLPKDKGTSTIPVTVRWQPDPGANFYQYKVSYAAMAENEIMEECFDKEGSQIIPEPGKEPPITEKNQFFLYSHCLGYYQWTVRSCWDRNCEEASPWANSSIWEFEAVQPNLSSWETGIVPCGRKYDNPDTPYNEREPCQIKHFGFMFQNIIDFLLWRVGLIVLLVLTIVTGLIYYSSLGDTEKIIQIKAMWRAAGMGFLIMLLAWTAINTLLAVLGFDVQFFGRWWKIEF